MIKNWTLGNFKSIDEDIQFEFRPLTIFTGANSSGKSTVLQSILLVTQTLQNPVPSHQIVLNGYIKKFGSYGDIVNERDEKKDIKIGFSIKDESRKNIRINPLISEKANSVSSELCISARNGSDLHPFLKSFSLASISNRGNNIELKLKREDKVSEEIKNTLKKAGINTGDDFLKYRVETGFFSDELSFLNQMYSKQIFCTGLNHFLPESLVYFTNRRERLKSFIRNMYLYYFNKTQFVRKANDANDYRLINDAIRGKAFEIIEEIQRSKNGKNLNVRRFGLTQDVTRNPVRYNMAKSEMTLDMFLFILLKENISQDDLQVYLKQLEDEIDKKEEAYDVDSMPNYNSAGVALLNSFFCNKIKYLGPLREEPKAFYPIESNSSIDNVGLKGENTAAVYENNKKNRVEFIDPNSLKDYSPSLKKAPLSEAVNKWLQYFGVADDISTNDMGKFGHELKIHTDNGLEQDLTHVGVGVSQVLPILVMSLLAKKDDVIILEQPELHLHPKVQSRLADFFVSMNALGKQCIIETHSEYLINRLRLLVAKSDDTKIADGTMIYFVEKDRERGCSKYREITINPYGRIGNWPDGFFDESENLAEQIVEAALEKKKREKMAK